MGNFAKQESGNFGLGRRWRRKPECKLSAKSKRSGLCRHITKYVSLMQVHTIDCRGVYCQWATLPNKKVEILGCIGGEDESRSAIHRQNQKALQNQPRTNLHPSANLSGVPVDKVTRKSYQLSSPNTAVFISSFSQGKPVGSTAHQLLTGVDKSVPDRLSVAPNAYPSTKMHNTSTDLTRKSADGSVVQDDVVSYNWSGMCCFWG